MGIYNKKNLAIFDIPIIYIRILFHNKLHESANHHGRLQKSRIFTLKSVSTWNDSPKA